MPHYLVTCVDVSLFSCAIFADTRYRSVLAAPSVLHSSHNFSTHFIQNLMTLCSFHKYHSLISVFQFFHSFTVSLNTARPTLHIIITDLCCNSLSPHLIQSYCTHCGHHAQVCARNSRASEIIYSSHSGVDNCTHCGHHPQVCVLISSSHAGLLVMITVCSLCGHHPQICARNSYTA